LSDKPTLKLDWCSHAAAKYAVEHWHYSKRMPRTRIVHIGVWEAEHFIGAVLLNNSANKNLVTPYGLGQKQGAELVRIALRDHRTSVTKILSIAISMLKKQSPGLRLLLSFADTAFGHHGGIYQGGNWIYAGLTTPSEEYIVGGKRFQGRALRATRSSHAYGAVPAHNVALWAEKVLGLPVRTVMGSMKHRYLYPLDAAMRAQIAPLAQPYPKRATSILADASLDQREESGAAPTVALATG
jgi:hypothetical protein